jgi:hypothetical protein
VRRPPKIRPNTSQDRVENGCSSLFSRHGSPFFKKTAALEAQHFNDRVTPKADKCFVAQVLLNPTRAFGMSGVPVARYADREAISPTQQFLGWIG